MDNILKIKFDYSRQFSEGEAERLTELDPTADLDRQAATDKTPAHYRLFNCSVHMTFAEALPFVPFEVVGVMPWRRAPLPNDLRPDDDGEV